MHVVITSSRAGDSGVALSPRRGDAGPGWSNYRGLVISTIVVGYDGTEPASGALDRAIEEARSARAQLLVVAVAEMPLNPEGPQNFGTLDDTPARMIPLVEPPELEPILADAKERVDAAGLTGEYTWAAGEPASAIVGAAKERGAELIVIGAHHHGLLARILGPDVATQVKHDAGCDVIVAD
jgi:nucleotide-binding universal stress UspA family protein